MPARKASSLINYAFTFGACAAAAAAFALYYNKPHRLLTVPIKADAEKEIPDDKGLVMNCELGLACDSMHRKCPGYQKCGTHESCGFGILSETELIHETETPKTKSAELSVNQASHAAPVTVY